MFFDTKSYLSFAFKVRINFLFMKKNLFVFYALMGLWLHGQAFLDNTLPALFNGKKCHAKELWSHAAIHTDAGIKANAGSWAYKTMDTPGISADSFAVVINEVMADPYPAVGLPEAEYIELYNRTPQTMDLTGWSLVIDGKRKALPGEKIDPYQYLILCDKKFTNSFSPSIAILPLPVLPVLKNSGAHLVLLDQEEKIIDQMAYNSRWYQDESKEHGGFSLERIDTDNLCGGITNWQASISAQGGTPGAENAVFSENPDHQPPEITFSEVIDNRQLRILFSEPLHGYPAGEAINYRINHGSGMPDSVIINHPYNDEVLLQFTEPMVSEKHYKLDITEVADRCGNTRRAVVSTFIYHPEEPFDIVINEIMRDPLPTAGLPKAEYVEIYNRCEYPISLHNWQMLIGSSSVILKDAALSPGQYKIICENTTADQFSAYGQTIGVENFPAVNNSGTTIMLKNDSGKIISRVKFDESWYHSASKKEGGWSLEQIDPANPCSGKSNWRVSQAARGGTPGKKNSIMSSNPDITPINPLYLSLTNTNSLLIHFDEPYDPRSISDPGQYRIVDWMQATKIKPLPPDHTTLQLNFAKSFTKRIRYTLQINEHIRDCAGNAMDAPKTLEFAVPELPKPGDLVINEVLFNPFFGGVDFVEIHNRSDQTIALNRVCLATADDHDGGTTDIACPVDPGRLIFPGEYMVYTTDPANIMEEYPLADPEGFVVTEKFPAYSNDAGAVLLLDQESNLLDRLDYDAQMHHELLNNPEGISLERVNPERPSSERANWQSASETAGFATPTQKNSQFSDEAHNAMTLFVKPEVFSPDHDGRDDHLQIHYQFGKPGYLATVKIFDAGGRIIRHLINNQTVGTSGYFLWDGLDDNQRKARMGIYIVYLEIHNLKGDVRSKKLSCVLARKL